MIRVLLRLYPPAWRERYGAELSELVSATGLGPREALDLARAAMHERRLAVHAALTGRTTMAIGPAWRHPSGWAVAGLVLMAPTLTFVVGSVLAYQLGFTSILPAMDAANSWLALQPRIVDVLLALAPAAALLAAVAPLLRVDLRDAETGRQAVVAIRLRAVPLIISALALAVGGLLLWHFLAESMVRVAA